MIIKTIANISKTAGMVVGSLERRQKGSLFLAFVIMVITGTLTNVPAVVLGYLVDKLIGSGNMTFSKAIPYLIIIVSAILIREGMTVFRKYLVENTCTRVEKNRLVKLVGHMLRLEMNYYASVQVGALNGKIHRSIEGLVRIIKLLFLDFFPTGIAALIAIGIAIVKSPILGCIMALAIPFGFLVVLCQISSQEGIRIALLRDKEAIDGKVVELLSGIESVRSSSTEMYEVDRVDNLAENLRKKEIRHHISMAIFDCVKYLNEGTFHIAVIATSVYLATLNIISTGDVLTYSLLFLSAITPLREVHRILDEAHESSLRVKDLHALFNHPIDYTYSVKYDRIIYNDYRNNSPAIRISNISYSYRNGKNTKVLDNVNLKVYQGEVLGVVGPSGCGKSTLLKLILGLYHAENGHVYLNGKAIECMERSEISSHIGYVSQSPFMFAGTVQENITYGCGNVKEKDIHEACIKACIHDEIIQSMGGYNGIVAERGQNLSGGQKQRLAIARIMLRRPNIVLLDEATAALDNINEKKVQKGLEKLMTGRTVIIVAHRLTTLRKADRIIVLNTGKIEETGTYENLRDNNGLFSELELAVRE